MPTARRSCTWFFRGPRKTNTHKSCGAGVPPALGKQARRLHHKEQNCASPDRDCDILPLLWRCRAQTLRERLRGADKGDKDNSDLSEPNSNPQDEPAGGPRGLLRLNRGADRKKAADTKTTDAKSDAKSAAKPADAKPDAKSAAKPDSKPADKPDAAAEDNSPAAKTYEEGTALFQKGDSDGAVKQFDKVLQLDPLYAPAYRERGICHAMNGDFTKALADLDKAVKLRHRQTLLLQPRLHLFAEGRRRKGHRRL